MNAGSNLPRAPGSPGSPGSPRARPARERAALLCPGRGAYTEVSLGSLSGSLPFVERAEELRAQLDLPSLLELDRAERFSAARHLDPVNASALIWLVSMLDADRARERYDVVCVGGNSMGWYTALTVAGALSFDDGFRLVQGMAILQAEHAREVAGGQLVYPLVDDEWRPSAERAEAVAAALASAPGGSDQDDAPPQAFWSIRLGGYAVLAGSTAGVEHLLAALPAVELGKNRYPLKLVNHGPYHTPLVRDVSARAHELLAKLVFRRPRVTLIDGEGRRHTPWGADPARLREYTFGAQVHEPFDFTRGVRVALREHAPARLVLPGPGTSLVSPVGQILVAERWRAIDSRAAFQAAQEEREPLLVAMR